MPDPSDDAPKQHRRSVVLPPFFAPRTPRTNTPPEQGRVEGEAGRRRPPRLFTPPENVIRRASVSPAEPPRALTTDAPSASMTEASELGLEPLAGEGMLVPSSQDLSVLGGQPVADPFAGEPTPSAQQAPTDEAGTAGAALEGFEIERADLELDAPTSARDLEVEHFWSGEAGLEPDSGTEGVPPGDTGVAAGTQPAQESFDEPGALTVDEPPFWATPPAPEETATEDLPQPSRAPADELADALAWPDDASGGDASGMLEADPPAPDGGALSAIAHELRESAAPFADGTDAEPWEPAPGAGAASENVVADPSAAVAEALERIAQRVRAGEVSVPADAEAASDETALAVALAALLRRRPRS